MTLKLAYNECEKQIKKNSKTFYYAFSKLEEQDASAVYAVYAFCRYADDCIDETDDPSTAIINLKAQLDNFSNGEFDQENFIWVALNDVFTRYDMDIEPFYDMILGQQMDVDQTTYHTMDELLVYCARVASSVGFMLLPIIEPVNKDKLENHAKYLGYAMQITNITRDINEDIFVHKRVYIPTELMKKHNATATDFLNRKLDDNVVSLIKELIEIANNYYELANNDINLYNNDDVKVVILGASRLYQAILSEIIDEQYDIFKKKHYVSKLNKALIYKRVKKELGVKDGFKH
jgi:phytoene synthase